MAEDEARGTSAGLPPAATTGDAVLAGKGGDHALKQKESATARESDDDDDENDTVDEEASLSHHGAAHLDEKKEEPIKAAHGNLHARGGGVTSSNTGRATATAAAAGGDIPVVPDLDDLGYNDPSGYDALTSHAMGLMHHVGAMTSPEGFSSGSSLGDITLDSESTVGGTSGYIAGADTNDTGSIAKTETQDSGDWRMTQQQQQQQSMVGHSTSHSTSTSGELINIMASSDDDDEDDDSPKAQKTTLISMNNNNLKNDDSDSDSFHSCSTDFCRGDSDSDSSDSESESETIDFSGLAQKSSTTAVHQQHQNSTTTTTIKALEGAPTGRQSAPAATLRLVADNAAGGRGRGGGGRGGAAPAGGRGFSRSSSARSIGSRSPRPKLAPARIPRSARLGRGRGRGRGGSIGSLGRGRGMESHKSLGSLNVMDSNNNSNSASSRNLRPVGLLKRSATERLNLQSDSDDDGNSSFGGTRPKFKRKQRSKSMDLGATLKKGSRVSGTGSEGFGSGFFRSGTINSLNRYSVAFGHSREQHHYQPTVIRKSRKMDIQTGGETSREVTCQRIIDYPDAMNPNERRRKTVMRTGNDARDGGGQSMHGRYHEPQYRLTSRIHSNNFKEQIQSQSNTLEHGPMTSYLIWSLQSKFVWVLLSEAAGFLGMICIFAVCIYLGAVIQPECLRLPKGRNFEEGGAYFIDAFALSWTTFSTVGYGLVYPAVRTDDDVHLSCAYLTTITALEAFVGVLFASFCGAVVVGKITRAKSTASVRYSRRMILRFGPGVTEDDDDRLDDSNEKPVTDYEKKRLMYQCPVLEFRLANALFYDDTGEILNAKIHVVVSTLADKKKDQENSSYRAGVMGSMGNVISGGRPSLEMLRGMRDQASSYIRSKVPVRFGDIDQVWTSSRSGFKSSRSNSSSLRLWSSRASFASTAATSEANNSNTKAPEEERNGVMRRVSALGASAIESVLVKKRVYRNVSGDDKKENPSPPKRRMAICVEEDPTGGLSPKKLFSSLKLEHETHPFLKRVWTIRHVLNADSPLLSPRAVRIIKESRGRWPAEICHYRFIRANVDFQQLIVSLSGTVSGTNVYGLSVYEYRNLHVGYTFCPILQRSPHNGRLEVDLDSIDNLRVQRGGGAEPIDYYESKMNRENDHSTRGGETRQTPPRPPKGRLLPKRRDNSTFPGSIKSQSSDDATPKVEKVSRNSLNKGIREEGNEDLDSSMYQSQSLHERSTSSSASNARKKLSRSFSVE